jgi:ATP-binding cassette, subfamily B, bacterial
MTALRRYSDLLIFRRLLRQARPYWWHLAGSLVLNLLATPLALLTPLPLKIVVDSVIGSQPLPHFVHALLPARASHSAAVLALSAGLLLTVTLLRYGQTLASWMLQTYTGERLLLDFRARLFRHVQHLSLSYHDAKGTADSLYRIQYDAPAIQHIMVNGIIPSIAAACTLVGMVCVTARLDPQLALIALVVLPVLVLLARVWQRRLRARWSEVKQFQSSATSVVQEVLGAIRVVKAFAQEEREHERFIRHSSRGMREQIQVAFVQGGFDLLVGCTLAAGTAATLVLGVLHVQRGVLTLGELLLVMAYLAQLYAPIEAISKKTADVQSALAGAARAFALLDEEPDVVELPNARPLPRASGAVAFRDVSFSYDRDRTVLHRVTFEVATGTRVGIAGRTGAGKTTMVSLLTRCYDPTAGRILLDGVDLRDYRLADLRNQFAIVLQEPVLFSTSIAENIAYARPSASAEEIIAAAKAANAHDFIARLPRGYDTLVGERGICLSGGERQRIALARAFLKNAPILILDEPTSSVDVRTEAAIMEAMERLMQGRTTFMIAHRPDTLRLCDTLLVVENGRLVTVAPSRTTPAADAIAASYHPADNAAAV